MKTKLIITVTSAILVLTSGSFIGIKNSIKKPVDKNINVEVYKTASYIAPAYANTFATLEVTIVRVNGNKKDTAFQHIFQPKELKDYPASDKPLVQTITIPNVNDNRERLEIFYRLTYNTKGSELNFSEGTVIGKGVQSSKLNIKI
jgi:hypothetical protein